MKKVSAMMLVVALCSMMLVACGSKGDVAKDILGTWTMSTTDAEGQVLALEQTFLEDGTYKLVGNGVELPTPGTYTVEGDKLSMAMTPEGGAEEKSTVTIKIDGDTLTMTSEDGQELVYTKKK